MDFSSTFLDIKLVQRDVLESILQPCVNNKRVNQNMRLKRSFCRDTFKINFSNKRILNYSWNSNVTLVMLEALINNVLLIEMNGLKIGHGILYLPLKWASSPSLVMYSW